MKILIILGIIFVVILLFPITLGIPFGIYNNYQWNKNIYNEWELSDRASTIDKKLEHLHAFKDNLEEYNLTEGQARYIFKTKSTDLAENTIILDTLIERLENTNKLSKSSLEYQQALKQITTDEFQGFNTCIFADGYRRTNVFRYWSTLILNCQSGQYSGESSSY